MAGSYRASIPVALIAAVAGGCARQTPAPVAIAPPPAVAAPARVAMPAGASPGMLIPAKLADGRYPTPNDGISRPAAIWHLRVALNVAAIACRGSDGDTIATRYNALLVARRTSFATAQASVAGEYRQASATKWQSAWDDSMTRLYNHYALAPVRAGFCAAAGRVLAALPGVAPEALADYAPAALAELDRPFADFFRAYDAWRTQTRTDPVAIVAPPPGAAPVLRVDPAIFR